MKGRIRRLEPTFGFIDGEDGRRYFFHFEDELADVELQVGDRVAFEPVLPEPAKGPRAREVSWLPE